jgi:hypothetical protein
MVRLALPRRRRGAACSQFCSCCFPQVSTRFCFDVVTRLKRPIAYCMIRPIRSPLIRPPPCVCKSGLAGKPVTKHVRLHLPRKRSGHQGVHDAAQPAWHDSGAVLAQTPEALRYALLDAHRFHRTGLRIEAKLFEHRCVRQRGCQYADVDTQRFELIVKRLAKAVDIRLGATPSFAIQRMPFSAPIAPTRIKPPAPLGEFHAEMVADIQKRHRTEPQSRLEATADQASRTRRDFRCRHWRRQGRCRDRQWRRRVVRE